MLDKRGGVWLALGWAAIIMIVVFHQIHFWQSNQLDTDVLALLPENEQAPAVTAATKKLTDATTTQVVLLIGATDWSSAKTAAKSTVESLSLAPLDLQTTNEESFAAVIEFYRPWRDRLLTSQQREILIKSNTNHLNQTALHQLYQPNGPRLTKWNEDPFGLWPIWWSSRAAESQVRLRDGYLSLTSEGREWILLNYQSQQAAFSMSGSSELTEALHQARETAIKLVPDARIVAAGIPLYAEAAASQANREINVIGYGSLIAVLVLVWLCFRSLIPISLVALSLIIGCAVALSVTALIFDRVHLITLVFGSSLVGVAEDYGFHYFAARQGKPVEQRWVVLRHLMPGLTLALITSIVAYLAFGIAPFPGLRQMAVFSAVGLSAAFLTVICWFPVFDKGQLPATRFSDSFGNMLQHWGRWQPNRTGYWLAGLTGAFIVFGILQLKTRDDVRQLQSAPANLLADQKEVGKLLRIASPAQFYLIEGDDAEQVLQREELLKPHLDNLITSGKLPGYRALSDWIPSQRRQLENSNLTRQSELNAISFVAKEINESAERAQFSLHPLTLESWLASPAAPIMRIQWLGQLNGKYYSVVMMQGLTPTMLPALEQIGKKIPGIQWVNKTAEISSLMARYRLVMGALLLAGYLGVFAALSWRFRKNAWRAILPTALGSLITLAICGFVGEPLQLFSVLAQVLLLGMGVDYGIFLLEHPDDNSTWVAVALAGISTLLSFGLLALSVTPALHAFGFTMLIGEVFIWLLTPCFRPQTTRKVPTEPSKSM